MNVDAVANKNSNKIINMQAVRQIVDVKDNILKILLPDDFKAEKVEVIILQLETQTSKKEVANLRGSLNLTDAQYADFQENVTKSREEW